MQDERVRRNSQKRDYVKAELEFRKSMKKLIGGRKRTMVKLRETAQPIRDNWHYHYPL